MNCNDYLFRNLTPEQKIALTRRQFLGASSSVLGATALGSLLGAGQRAMAEEAARAVPHFAPKAKQVIYLHMVGGPSQMDLFDYKPEMEAMYDKDLPDSIRNGQRLTGMTSGQARFPVAPSKFQFAQHGQSGMWVSEMLPQTAPCRSCMV